MALIKCPECGNEVSSEANICVHCGFLLRKLRKPVPEEPKAKPELHGKYVIGYRCGPGSIIVGDIIVTVFGLIAVISSLIAMYAFPDALPAFVVLLIFGGLILLTATIDFITMTINKSNKENCIVYDYDTRELILSTIGGKRIVISPEDYVELRDNFFTSNLLHFTYLTPLKRLKRVNLGYCADRNQLRSKLSKVLDHYRESKRS